MSSTRFTKQQFAVLAAIACTLGTAPTSFVGAEDTLVLPAHQSVTDPWIDTSDRQAVINAGNAEFSLSDVDPAWTGDRDSCQPGTTSPLYRSSSLRTLNFYRALAGVPANVIEDEALTARAQATALMNSASGRISHYPGTDYECWTQEAADTAAESNLYLGRTGPYAITGYMWDPGSGNISAGHRNWMLHTTLRKVGIGEVPLDEPGRRATNVLLVVGSPEEVFGLQPQVREAEGFVAWPYRGYNLSELVFDRWSFSLRGANFANATVTATIAGQVVDTPIEFQSTTTNGAPFPSIVWNVPAANTRPEFDLPVTITIDNVKLGSQTTSYTYTSIIIGDKPLPAPDTFNAFIDRSYRDFLGRPASTSETSVWGARLSSGTSRLEFVNTLAASDEWTTVVVQDLYRDTLGREADAEGAAYWAGRLQSGTSVASAASNFYGSTEYVNAKGGTWPLWLTDLYGKLLNRGPESSGLRYWVTKADTDGSGPVAYDFYQSEESRRSRVRDLYQKFLGRQPDAAGLSYWAGVLESGDDLALAGFLAASDEYLLKAG